MSAADTRASAPANLPAMRTETFGLRDRLRATRFISTNFSLGMLARDMAEVPTSLLVEPLTPDQARQAAKAALSGYANPINASGCGWLNSASALGYALGVPIIQNRSNIQLLQGDTMLIGRLDGTRLPEDCRGPLPDGAAITWFLATLQEV